MIPFSILYSLALWDVPACLEGLVVSLVEPKGYLRGELYIRALQRTYVERCCVHVCIQLCTRRYTVVYTRVYLTLLGSRYTIGVSAPRMQMFLSCVYAP